MVNICVDADWLSLDYLITECIWDPADNELNDGETLHSEPKELTELMTVVMRVLAIRTVRKRRSAKIKSMCDELRTVRRKPPESPSPGESAVKCPFWPAYCLTVKQQARPFFCNRFFDGKFVLTGTKGHNSSILVCKSAFLLAHFLTNNKKVTKMSQNEQVFLDVIIGYMVKIGKHGY